MEIKDIISRLNEAIDHPNRIIKHFKEKTGQKVIGCAPPFTPQELVHAAGMLPVGVWGANYEVSEANQYYPTFYCSILLTILELGLQGKYSKLSGLLTATHCDGLKNLVENWKYGVKDIEMISLTYPHNRKLEAAKRYLIKEFKIVAETLERISGNIITEKNLRQSIKIYNHHRKLMRDFSALTCRHLDVITPTVRHVVMKSAYFMAKEEHSDLVQQLLDALKKRPDYDFKGYKIILTGIIVDLPDLLKMLEDNHIAVVGDDLVHESKQYETDVPTGVDPYECLARQWSLMEGASMLFDPEKKRGTMLVDLAKKRKADGILVCMLKFCEPDEFDYPILRKDFEGAGIPELYLEIETQSSNDQQAATRIQAFTELLKYKQS
jgi:bcr-type benzoyl-CoA reductase subunit C